MCMQPHDAVLIKTQKGVSNTTNYFVSTLFTAMFVSYATTHLFVHLSIHIHVQIGGVIRTHFLNFFVETGRSYSFI